MCGYSPKLQSRSSANRQVKKNFSLFLSQPRTEHSFDQKKNVSLEEEDAKKCQIYKQMKESKNY